MIAVAISFLVLGFWTLVGYCVLTAVWPARMPLRQLLLAPGVGISVLTVLVFLLNLLGLSVGQFGPPLSVLLLVFSGVWLAIGRPGVHWRSYAPFAALIVVAFVVTGWPMFEFGLDWISYANDDMANYVLFAERYLHHGFYELPDVTQMTGGLDYSLYYWFLDLSTPRPGGALLLAWVRSVTGTSAHAAFMPLILAAHMALVSVTGGLVYIAGSRTRPALLTCGLLSISALASLGVLYQLLPQVLGLAMVTAMASLLLGRLEPKHWSDVIRASLVVGMFGAALLITYPEVVPFIAGAVAIYAAVSVWRKTFELRTAGALWLGSTVVALVITNSYIQSVVNYTLGSLETGQRGTDPERTLFPYYLVPSGLANLWGFMPIAGTQIGDPWLSITIALGALLLVIATVATARLSLSATPVSLMAAVMLVAGLRLFFGRADFGLFKLAMFIQPFLIGTLVVWWCGIPKRFMVQALPLLTVGAAGLFGQLVYVYASLGSGLGGAFVEIPDGSRSAIVRQFQSIVNSDPAGPLILDTSSSILAKFQAAYTRGTPTNFPTRDYFFRSAVIETGLPSFLGPDLVAAGDERRRILNASSPPRLFKLFDPQQPLATNRFLIDKIAEGTNGGTGCGTLVETTASQSLFNRIRPGAPDGGDFIAVPCTDVHDRLIFIDSALGSLYYLAGTGDAAFYGFEPDILFGRGMMAAVGRHLLFQILNPSESVHLVLDMTDTLQGDGRNALPPAAAIGAERTSFGLIGRGAARVFSPSLHPQIIDGRAYVAVDMGTDGERLPDSRKGLMNLYGTDVVRDHRNVVGFGRDISVVSDTDYQQLEPPQNVAAFPDGLRSAGLEYSGVYEDGWVSESAFFELTRARQEDALIVRGVLPRITDPNPQTDLVVLVDGEEVARQHLTAGDFQVRGLLPNAALGRHRIDLRFSGVQSLPDPDFRPAAARLDFVGFDRA